MFGTVGISGPLWLVHKKEREKKKREREGNNKDEKKLGNGTFLTCANVNKKMGAY